MGGAVSISDNNDDMVTKLINAHYIKTTTIERAFRAVDRGHYVTNSSSAYSDSAWKSEHLHVSAPCVYARVLEGLLLEPGLSFLNIGSGTGYLSSMVGTILGSEGTNHGIELHGDVVRYAKLRLKHFKKTLSFDESFFADPVFVEGNAFLMQPPKAKYDRIYCGAAVPLSFVDMIRDHFLKVGGIIVAPIEDELVQVYKESPLRDICISLLEVSFAHLVRRVSNDKCEIVANNTVRLPSHHVRSLQEQCRALVVGTIRTQVIEKKSNRGGVFAPVFALENSLPLPPILPPRKLRHPQATNENLLRPNVFTAPTNTIRRLRIELDRNITAEAATRGDATPAAAGGGAATSITPASCDLTPGTTIPAGNSVNTDNLVANPTCTDIKPSESIDLTCNQKLNATSVERTGVIRKSIDSSRNARANESLGDVNINTVPTNPSSRSEGGSIRNGSADTVSEITIPVQQADFNNKANTALLSANSPDLLNGSQMNLTDVPIDAAVSNEVTNASKGSCNFVSTNSCTTVVGSSDQQNSLSKSPDPNDACVPSTSASIKPIDGETPSTSNGEKKNTADAATPLIYPLLTNSHLTIKEYMLTHFLSTKTMYHGYREDKRVYRACGKKLIESHRSVNAKKSKKPVNKNPPFKLRTGHQPEGDAAHSGDETNSLPDSDSDPPSNASSDNTSDSSRRHDEDEAPRSSSSSPPSEDRVVIARKRGREEDVEKRVRDQRRIRAFNARNVLKTSEIANLSINTSVVGHGSTAECASQIPPSVSKKRNLSDALPQHAACLLKNSKKVQPLASTSEPSTSGLQDREPIGTAGNVDSTAEQPSRESLSVVEAMDVDGDIEMKFESCVDVEVEKINSKNNPTLFTEAKNVCNKESDKDDDRIKNKKLGSNTDLNNRETPSLKRSSSDSDDELEQISSDSTSFDAVDSKGRRKKAIKRELGDGPKSNPRRTDDRQLSTGDDSETNSSNSIAETSSCTSQDVLKKDKQDISKPEEESSTWRSPRTSSRPTPPRSLQTGYELENESLGPSSNSLEESLEDDLNEARRREEDLNEARRRDRRATNRLSMISLFNRFAYSVPDRDSMYSEALNVRDDAANGVEIENDDGDSADNVDFTDLESAMFQRRRNWGAFQKSTDAENDEMSSSDEEPEYFKQNFMPRITKLATKRTCRRKRDKKIWVHGTDGFASYIDSKQRKLPFKRLPRDRRFEVRMQDRLHRLPLPPQVLDYLLTGRWPQPPLPSTPSTPSSAEEEKEDSLC